jgi:hypothetical protein
VFEEEKKRGRKQRPHMTGGRGEPRGKKERKERIEIT